MVFKKGNQYGKLQKGKPKSPEQIEKMRQNQVEKWKNPLYRERQIKLRKGKHYSPKTEFKQGHSMNKGVNKGRSYEEIFGEGKGKIMRQRRGEESKGRKHTEETKRKIRLGNVGRVVSEETREKIRLVMMRNRKKGVYHQTPNKPEKIMINLIKKNNLPFNYVGDGQINIGCFNPDFLSKNPKHIIEVFGDYWHNLPKVKERDKRRLKTYSKYGYETLVIWEHELKNKKKVLEKIRSWMSK